MTALAPGFRLGPYEIVAKLGAGGMGEVWRARDIRLDREVALKLLPAGFADDGERHARFEREAKVLASLNHPHIATLHSLEHLDGQHVLVMELVEGEDLAQRLARGPIPLDEATAIARQIAEALEAAHERGIVHRDLKPANVKVRSDGTVKVLDFGLAKALDPMAASGAADLGHSPTITHAATMAGLILGTAAYMSPEQAKGGAVDKRADIWAFGVVLHEMVTGARLFAGDSVAETLAGVLRSDVTLSALPAETPRAIRDLLRRCLERNPKNRLHDIADARIVLDEVIAGKADAASGPPAAVLPKKVRTAGWPSRLAWLGAGLALGAAAIAGLGRSLFVAPPARPPVVRSLTYSGTSRNASISADGRHVAFVSTRDGASRIWVKQLATGEEVALTAGPDSGPRVSPDSSSVLFARAADRGFDLHRVPLVGGEPRRLARDIVFADWSPDGRRIAFARVLGDRCQVVLIPAEGGEEQVLIERDGLLTGPSWSPDGRRLLVVESARVNTIANRVLATIDVASRSFHEHFRLPSGSPTSHPRWDGDNAIVFAWSPSQAGRGEIVLQRLALSAKAPRSVFSFTSMPQRIELAGPGTLLFDSGGARQNLIEVGSGPALGRALTGGPTLDRQPAFSPDGRRIVFTSDRSGSLDLWSLDVGTAAVRRLTFDAADDWDPQWSPDGQRLLWSSNRSGNFEIWIAEPDGAGARRVTSDGVDAENPTMSADGAWIVYSSSNPAAPGIWRIHPDGQGATRLLAGSFFLPELAPSSGWIVAVHNDGVADGVTPLRVIRVADGATVADLSVPGEGGNMGRSRWMPDGRTLVSWGEDESGRTALFRQPVVPGRGTRAGRELLVISGERGRLETFGISPVDGRIVVSVGQAESDVMLAEGIPGIGESLRRGR